MAEQLQKTILNVFQESLDEVFTVQQTWLEEPIPFRAFVESDDHMGFPPLSERQYAVADFMLTGNITKIFDNLNTMAVLVWGKGSGKDALACLIILYIVYWLLCLRSPQQFFGLPEGEAIDVMNVAANAEQANSVFFDKLRQRVIRWKWLKEHYPLKLSGIFLGQLKPEDFLNNVVVTKNGVLFPKNIRAFSGHSQEASQEGKNVLAFVLDEAAAFDDSPTTNRAQKIFDMLRSSATSRFGQRWKGFCLSFPRYKGDFILKLSDVAEGELHWFSDKGATWDVKPNRLFKDYPEKYFEFEGSRIPLEFKKDFELDPSDAKGKYICDPVEIAQAFFEYPDKVDLCIDFDRQPIAVFEDYIENSEVKKKIISLKTDSVLRDYICTIDLGLKNDSAALSLFHKELRPDGQYFIQDIVTSWVPNKEKGHIVSLTNLEDAIRTLKDRLHIIGVYFDQWNSALLTQRLNNSGISSDIYHLSFQDYKNWKENMYLGKVRLLHFQPQLTEIKRLILARADRVDHPADGSKDLVDTLVGATRLLLGGSASATVPSALGGEIIMGNNLAAQGGSFL